MGGSDGSGSHPLAGTIVLPAELNPVVGDAPPTADAAHRKLTNAQKRSTLPIPDDVVAAVRAQSATPFGSAGPAPTSADPSKAAHATASFQAMVNAAPAVGVPAAARQTFDLDDLEETAAIAGKATVGSAPADVDPLRAMAAGAADVPLEGTMAVHGAPTMSSPYAIAGPEEVHAHAPIPGAPWSHHDPETDARADADERARVEGEARARADAEARVRAEAEAEGQARRLELEAEQQVAREAAERVEKTRLQAEERRRLQREAFEREQQAAAEAERRRKAARKEEQVAKAAALRKGMYGGFGPKS